MDEKKIKTIKEILSYVAIVAAVILVRVFIFDPVMVDGPSMDTTLTDGQILILNKFIYRKQDIQRYDIVVIRADNKKIIKRVIGLPNETVEIKNNEVYVDGKKINNSFASTKTDDFDLSDIGLVKVPGDSYFVLGDNRNNSSDSRTIGPIKKKDIMGVTSTRIIPKFGNIDK